MEAFFVSTGLVALGEIGDKTQLLAILLAARFRRPWPIVAGIFVATLLNHALAGSLGGWVAHALGPRWLGIVVGLAFIGMAIWMLIPDSADDLGEQPPRHGVFVATVIAFFLAEMGDKTQIATVALAARYSDLVAVVAGSTLGLMLANVPAVWLGDRVTRWVPMRTMHIIAAVLFAVLGIATLWGSAFVSGSAAA